MVNDPEYLDQFEKLSKYSKEHLIGQLITAQAKLGAAETATKRAKEAHLIYYNSVQAIYDDYDSKLQAAESSHEAAIAENRRLKRILQERNGFIPLDPWDSGNSC